MPTCRHCGAELRAFSFGSLPECCRDCRPTPVRKEQGVLDGIPERQDAPVPWITATSLLLAINIGIFVAMVATGISAIFPESEELLKWGADYGPLTLGGEYWRAITSAFVHIGVIHLALNMWCLWRLGTVCQRILGQVPTIGVYLVGGAGAALLSLSWDPLRVSAGASGAIFAIVGALISVLQFGSLGLVAEKRRNLLAYVVRFAIYNLLFGLMGPIDNMAHLGGLVTGLLLGFGFSRTFPEQEKTPVMRRYVLLAGTAMLLLTFVPVTYAKRYLVEAEIGRLALTVGDLRQAAIHLQRSVDLRGDDPDSRSRLGYTLDRLEEYPRAMQEYERTLVLAPGYPTVEENLARLYLLDGRSRDAVRLYALAVTRREADAQTFRGYGNALYAEKDIQAAEVMLRKALQSDDSDVEAHITLADVLDSQGKEREAKEQRMVAEKLRMEREEKD